MAKETAKKKVGIGEYFKGVKIEMKKVVKDVFQSLLDEHVEEKHNLMNGQSIS